MKLNSKPGGEQENPRGFCRAVGAPCLGESGAPVERLGQPAAGSLGQTVESVRNQLESAENKAAATTKSIQHFSRLTVTALREHFTDDEISRLFGILNPDLLGLAVGRTGITLTLSNAKEVVARLKQFVARIANGVYQDDSMTVRLGPPSDVLSKFQSVETLERELERENKNVVRLTALLDAVTKRDETARKVEELKQSKQAQADRLAAYRQFKADSTKETEWRSSVGNLAGSIKAVADAIVTLETNLENQRNELTNLAAQKTSAAHQYQQVLKRFDDCRMALFNVSPRADAEIPDDFDGAVSFYSREHKKESDLTNDFDKAFGRLGVFADRFKSNDEAETVRNLEQELDALPEREKALQLRWSSHIHGLKSRFQEVLNDLRLVESAKDRLNRELSHVPVSDLKGVKLIVERQSDEVSLIERLAVDELNSISLMTTRSRRMRIGVNADSLLVRGARNACARSPICLGHGPATPPPPLSIPRTHGYLTDGVFFDFFINGMRDLFQCLLLPGTQVHFFVLRIQINKVDP